MEDDSVLVRDPETKKIRTHHMEKRGKSACNHSSFTKTGVEVSDTSVLMVARAAMFMNVFPLGVKTLY